MNMSDKYPKAPVLVLAAIHDYVELRREPGGFAMALLENDLRGAMGRADPMSIRGLFDLVQYCHWEIPGVCWGSPEKVQAWLTGTEHTRAQDNLDLGEGGALDAEEDQAQRDRAEADKDRTWAEGEEEAARKSRVEP